MDEHIVILSGLPLTCNPIKMKLRFEAECQVRIESIVVHNTFAEVKLASQTDFKSFREKFPQKIKFGNDEVKLTILDKRPTSVALERELDVKKSRMKTGFRKPETWSSLSKLPPCNCGIVVQPTSNKIMPEDVRAYFEANMLSCGGPISTLIPMIDGIFITFKDKSVAEKVWSSRPHRINNEPALVYLKEVPPKHEQQLIVKPHKEKLDEEKLKVLLGQCTGKEVPLKAIKTISEGIFHVVYKETADKDDIQCIVDEFQSQNPNIHVSFHHKTDCIIVGNSPVDMSDHEIKMLFENSAKSGGGPVTRIDHVKNGLLLVYFSSYKDAGAVCDKSAKKELSVFGRTLKIRRYFHNISERKLEKPNQLDEIIKPWLARRGRRSVTNIMDAMEKTVINRNLDPNLMRFFLTKQVHVMQLKDCVGGMADVNVAENSFQIAFKTNEEDIKRAVLSEIEKFLEAYQVKSLTVNDETMKQIVDCELSKQDDKDDICSWYSGSGNDTLIIAGVKKEVDSSVGLLQNLSDTQRLTLDEASVRWLVETDTLEQLKKDHKAIVGSIQSDILLLQNGREFQEAKQAVQEILKTLKSERFVPDNECYIMFLSDGEFKRKVMKNVDKIFKTSMIPAILVVADDVVSILGPPDRIGQAIQVLNAELAVDESFDSTSPGLDKRKLAAAWGKILAFESDGRLKRILRDNVTLLVGFREVVKCSRDYLGQCGLNFTEEFIEMDPRAAKHMFDYQSRCSEMCNACKVLHDVGEAGITLKGDRTDVSAVAVQIRKFSKDIVKETTHIKHPKAADFFSTNEGKQLLSMAGEAFRSTVSVQSKTKPQIASAVLQYGGPRRDFSSGTAQGVASPLSMQLGSLIVTLRKGDITEETNEAIVNSASIDFNLSIGAISRAILRKAGSLVQTEASEHRGRHMCITSGGNLNCKAIIHVVLPVDLGRMQEVITDVLIKADQKKFESISIPAIGTGHPDFGNRVIAQIMYCSIRDFAKSSSKIKHLRVLDIVLFNDWLMEDFKEEFSAAYQASGKEKLHKESFGKALANQAISSFKSLFSSESTSKSRIFGQLTVTVRQGDITEETNDAIVNSANFKSDLSHGRVSQKILAKGGWDIQLELEKNPGKNIRVTGCGNLKCKKIIHVDFDHDRMKIGECIAAALEATENNKCTSVSIPAIGTGNVGLPGRDVANIMSGAIQDFDHSHPKLKHLSKVDIVIYQRQQMKDFSEAFFEVVSVQSGFSAITEDSGVTVEAFSFERDKAKEALYQIKMKLAIEFGNEHVFAASATGALPIKDGEDFGGNTKTYSWKYKEEQGEWQRFNKKDSECLEKFYQKNPKSRKETLEFNGKPEVVDFVLMMLGSMAIHRTSLAGYKIRENGLPS